MPDNEEVFDEKEEGVEEKSSTGGISTTVILVVVAVFALLLAVGGAFFMVSALSKAQKIEDGSAKKSTEEKVAENKSSNRSLGELYAFERAIIVNLAETNAERYLKLEIVLELDAGRTRKEVDARLPQVQDMLIGVTSTKTLEDVSTTSGRNMLRQEMVDKINSLLTTGRILNIYFTEFVVQ